ncbi:MAG: Mrp/NBP35 family ATP-binding protein [Alphaproteobacteria bacterium]|nr:Mrp/NBP35 family ATP-binding protein [Alphaproteobacteria bacterium]
MPQPTQDAVLSALARVKDPDTGRSVIDAGMIQGLVIKGSNVGFSLEVPPARGPQAEPLRKACEAAVSAIAGVTSVTAVLTAHRDGPAAPPSRPSPSPRPAPRAGLDGVNAVIAVASGKGGVGKSTVAANLALALARLGLKVGLLDADIYGPSLPRLFAIDEKPKAEGQKLLPIMKYGIKTMSIGFLVPPDQAMIWRGPMVQSALTQMLGDVAWAPLDVLVVDMPPGTGDAQLTMAQQVPLKGALIVSTPQDLALIDARRGIAMFQKTHVPILGLIENMSVFICPHCGEPSHIFGHGGARQTAEDLGVPFLGEIPLVGQIRALSDAGTPIVAHAPDSREAQAFLALAREVATRLEGTGRAAPRLVLE